MAKKKLIPIKDTPVGKELAANFEAAERGELDNSKLNGVILEDAKPPAGVTLEPVRMFAIAALIPHPLNVQFFRELPPDERQALKNDIEARGVLVPVIATAAGVILSGHRRAVITRELGRAFIPVQFIRGELTPAQEREFLIKDNLLRRHLGPDEKKALIVALYGDEIAQDGRGGDRKSQTVKSKVQSELLISEADPLPVRIERETAGAISAGTAKRLVADIRKERKGEHAQAATPAADPLKAVKAHLAKIVKLLDGADRRTVDAAIIEIAGTLDALGIDARYSGEVKKIIQNVRA